MKKKLLLLSLLFVALYANAQGCLPNPALIDAPTGIFPIPYHPENATEGGITDTACVGMPFNFTFTTKFPMGSEVTLLNSFLIRDVTFDPPLESFDFVCDPPGCLFYPPEVGCIQIFGTATEEEIGDHLMYFKCTANWFYNGGEVMQQITIPELEDGFFISGGIYNLNVREATGFANCDNPVGIADAEKQPNLSYNYPNPFSSQTTIELPPIGSAFDFKVLNQSGQIIYSEKIYILDGNYQFIFDGTALPAGIYVYALTNDAFTVSQRMIIQK